MVFAWFYRTPAGLTCRWREPDSGKALVRSLRTVVYLREAPYMDDEPDISRIFDLIK